MRITWRGMMVAAAGMMLAGCLPMVGGGGLPLAFLGGWEGEGAQVNPPGEWTISADILGGQPGTVVGTIAYPSLECRGELILRAVATGAMELGERITAGDCVDGGVITLTVLEDGRLRYVWRKEGDALEAEGVLWRRGT